MCDLVKFRTNKGEAQHFKFITVKEIIEPKSH